MHSYWQWPKAMAAKGSAAVSVRLCNGLCVLLVGIPATLLQECYAFDNRCRRRAACLLKGILVEDLEAKNIQDANEEARPSEAVVELHVWQ